MVNPVPGVIKQMVLDLDFAVFHVALVSKALFFKIVYRGHCCNAHIFLGDPQYLCQRWDTNTANVNKYQEISRFLMLHHCQNKKNYCCNPSGDPPLCYPCMHNTD